MKHRIKKIINLKILFLGSAVLLAGCMPKTPARPAACPTTGPVKPINYDILQEVVNKYTCQGLVKYRSLKETPGRLVEFLDSAASIGPQSTPQYFPNSAQQLAFWINVYSAAGLKAGVDAFPANSARPFWASLEDSLRVKVDCRTLTLRQIGNLARQAGNNDPRIDLALVLPAKGSGTFPACVYLPETLETQLNDTVKRALNDPMLFKIDHAGWALRLARPLYRNREKYIQIYQTTYRTEKASILNALAVYADPEQRAKLNSAVGYPVVELPFDWSLNVFNEPPCILDNYQ